AIASPHATNEDLFVLRRLLEALGSSQVGYAVRRGPADDLLIRAEKAANAEGCRALGFGEAGPLLERARGGAVDAMIVLGSDALVEPGLLDVLRGLDTVLYVDTHHSPVETVAHVIFPARHAAEKHGTLTNHAGRVQRVAPAVEPPFEAFAEGALLWRLGQALGLPGFEGAWDVAAVSKALAEAVPAFAGITLDAVPPTGVWLAGRGPDARDAGGDRR